MRQRPAPASTFKFTRHHEGKKIFKKLFFVPEKGLSSEGKSFECKLHPRLNPNNGVIDVPWFKLRSRFAMFCSMFKSICWSSSRLCCCTNLETVGESKLPAVFSGDEYRTSKFTEAAMGRLLESTKWSSMFTLPSRIKPSTEIRFVLIFKTFRSLNLNIMPRIQSEAEGF